jgi:hypothetical protein
MPVKIAAAGAAERAALEPPDEPDAGATGAAPRLDGVDPGCRRGPLTGLGRTGAGRSRPDEPPRSISFSSRSGVTMERATAGDAAVQRGFAS